MYRMDAMMSELPPAPEPRASVTQLLFLIPKGQSSTDPNQQFFAKIQGHQQLVSLKASATIFLTLIPLWFAPEFSRHGGVYHGTQHLWVSAAVLAYFMVIAWWLGARHARSIAKMLGGGEGNDEFRMISRPPKALLRDILRGGSEEPMFGILYLAFFSVFTGLMSAILSEIRWGNYSKSMYGHAAVHAIGAPVVLFLATRLGSLHAIAAAAEDVHTTKGWWTPGNQQTLLAFGLVMVILLGLVTASEVQATLLYTKRWHGLITSPPNHFAWVPWLPGFAIIIGFMLAIGWWLVRGFERAMKVEYRPPS